ncbi:MAG: FecR domain-containing protein [Desulfovibrio sp.]|nr:FecR domain-containing protein [Desulfovibrio sp.]
MKGQDRVHNTAIYTIARRTCLACLLAAFCFGAAAAHAAGGDVGQAISVVPGAFVERDGARKPLVLNDAVRATDRVITDATGKVRILFHDDGAVSLGSNTSLDLIDVMPEGDTPVFKAHVAQGLARFITGKIVEQNPKGFSVSTPEGTAGIRGTIFTLQTGNGRTTIYVANATRDVTLSGVSVPSGFKMTLPGGSPVRMTPEDVSFTQSIAAAPPSSTQENAPAEQAVAAVFDNNDPSTSTTLAGLPMSDMTTSSLPVQPGTAYVSGTLTPDAGSWMSYGTYSGNFSFKVDLSSGAISNAAMSASATNPGNNIGTTQAYNYSGGSGSMSGGSFTITGFAGSLSGTFYNYPAGTSAGSGTHMTGSGNVDAVGGSVNGSFSATTPTNSQLDDGTFSGTRTQ